MRFLQSTFEAHNGEYLKIGGEYSEFGRRGPDLIHNSKRFAGKGNSVRKGTGCLPGRW